MIKQCRAYKLYCDVCGKQLGGVFGSKDSATVYAIMSGYYRRKQEQFFCSFKCRDELIRREKEEKKGGKR